jgi:NAD(P)H-hydrate repair Nnr-like enzyme with NAD(P)H-hydrate dehydratase domain
MDSTYWHKQGSEPLFPDLLWSRPENRRQAGKLLIVGGNAHGFAAPAEAFAAAAQAGIGSSRAVLPDHIRPQLRHFQAEALELDFLPSTPSGSFARSSLAELLAHSQWADSVLLAGDLGRNSETAILLESFVSKYRGPLVVTKDAADYFTSHPMSLADRTQTLLVISLAQLQKFASNLHFEAAVTFSMDLLQLVDWLHQFTLEHGVHIITKHLDTVLVAVDGKVSTTKTGEKLEESWRVSTAAAAAVWLLQNPRQAFESLTTAIAQGKNS